MPGQFSDIKAGVLALPLDIVCWLDVRGKDDR